MVPSGPNEHLFVVTLGPMVLEGHGPEPQVVIVSFSSVKPGLPFDDACLIPAGSHPFIVRDSYIYYREPRIYPAATVEERVNSDQWRQGAPCDDELLRRILSGFRRSKRLPRHFNEILDAFNI